MTAKFWVGGTGTWDNSTTTHWSLSTGGAGGAAVPGAADTITFDANSGGGTVTVDTTINGLTFTSITMGAFTGTLDFSVNNPSITLGTFSGSGTGARTLKMGSGTWTINGVSGTIWDFTTVTNFVNPTTFAGTSTLALNLSSATGQTRTVVFGTSFTYSTVSFGSNSAGGGLSVTNQTGITIGTLLMSGINTINFQQISLTITNAVAFNGGSINSMIYLNGGANGVLNVAAGSTINYCVLRQMTFTGAGSPIIANNSIDLGGNISATINGPTGGGGSHMIGG